MEQGNRILAVDDELINREILSSSLEAHYDVRCVASGKDCLNLLDNWVPDIILMDSGMPIMNGLETCKLIKTHSLFRELPVIFLSDKSSPDERLAGYKAGGIDFISKPFVPNELIAKINISLSHRDKIKLAYDKTNIVKLTARTAVDSAVEASHVMRFLQNCLSSTSLEQIIEHLFNAISEYHLHAIAEFRCSSKNFVRSNKEKVNQLEIGLLHKMKNKTEAYRFGKRLIYNRNTFSLLLLDLPEDDYYKCDRIIDNVEILVDGACSAIVKLLNNENLQKDFERLKSRYSPESSHLEQFPVGQQDSISVRTEQCLCLINQVTNSVIQLNLDNEHENNLLSLISASVQNKLNNSETEMPLELKLKTILSQPKFSA